MKGLTALVISHLNGFGLNIVQQLVKQGCNVIVNGLGEERNDERIPMIRLSANLQKETEVHNLVEQIFNRYQTIDIVIFNNQHQRDYRAAIDEYPLEYWREIINRNLISTFSLIKTIWPQMKRQHFGRILHLTNEHCLIGSEYQSACIASHHALIGLSKALSIEGAPFGITSNVIYQGQTRTNTFEQLNHVKTLADLVVFLCSNQVRSINGQLISWSE